MKQRIITGTVFTIAVLALVVPAYFYPVIMLLLSLIVSTVAIHELIKAARNKVKEISPLVTFLGGLTGFLPVITWLCGGSAAEAMTLYTLVAITYCFVTTMFPPIRKEDPDAIRSGLAQTLIIIYVSFPIVCLNTMALLIQKGWYFAVIGLFAPWISDVFAYFTGVLLGKHKIVPHISPKKTWEGCIGGAVFCSVLTALFFAFVMNRVIDVKIPFAGFVALAALFGFLLSVVSQLGDWMASSIKRMVGIKDFGKFMPGHGGMMDRFDSAFFTLPVALGLAFIVLLGV
ncbi:MAG: CDP-archaeol synthase [Clostridiales bacterium]|nr:CDP-archaeol synthase [Clostridiales bacterium]